MKPSAAELCQEHDNPSPCLKVQPRPTSSPSLSWSQLSSYNRYSLAGEPRAHPLSQGSSPRLIPAVVVALLHPPTPTDVAAPQLLLSPWGAGRSAEQGKTKQTEFSAPLAQLHLLPPLPHFIPSPPWKLARSHYQVFLKQMEEDTVLF